MEDNLQEARRYLNNAREILKEKARKEGDFYQDRKYVRLAGHAAYSGVLVALDVLIGKKKGRKSAEWYVENLRKIDRKALDRFNALYDVLHLSMAYDGVLLASVSREGLKAAEILIDWIETRSAAA
jgi:hypothetical protein